MQEQTNTADPARRLVAPLCALVVACVALPLVVTVYLGFSIYWDLSRAVDERILRTLDVLQEHALKVLHTTDRLLIEADSAVTGGRLGQPEDEAGAHRKLAELQSVLPEVEAIWLFAPDGRAIASSTVFPVPAVNNSDRDYFRAQREQDAGFFIGPNVRAKVGDLTFFVVSRRRPGTPERPFGGVVALTLPPAKLVEFYEKVVRNTDISAGLFRADGTPLARFPEPTEGLTTARTTPAFLQQLRIDPDTGEYTVTSGLDGVVRRIAYRRIASYPVYVTAGYARDAIWREWGIRVLDQAKLGFPLTILLLAMSWFALRRSRELIHEFELRRRAEDALRHSQRLEALGHLTGGVAHDFNNLLMIVQGSADRIDRDPLTPRQEKMLGALREAVRRGESLTRQLLSYSRRSAVSPQIVRLQDKFDPLRQMLRTSLRGDILLTLEIDPETRPVFCDESELDLALLNLAVNARDAMPRGGEFRVTAKNEPGDAAGVLITVSDTGQGISRENLDKIFDPFFTTKDVGRGTGLGLSQVYGFATRAGGQINVISNVGEGTTFRLFLPQADPAAVPNVGTPEISARATRAMRILLAEDNNDVAEVTRANLEADGHEVIRASNVREALRLLENESSFDVLLSDIVMPGGLSGLDLAREVEKRWPDIGIILATGYSAAALDGEASRFDLLRKPYTTAKLRDALAKLAAEQQGRVLASRSVSKRSRQS